LRESTRMPGNHEATSASSRQDVIAAAKLQLTAHFDKLLEARVPETFDTCSIAWLHEVLSGDAEALAAGEDFVRIPTQLPLHEAIMRTWQGGSAATESLKMKPATEQQIADAAAWLTERIFHDAWQLLPDREERESRGETPHDVWQQEMYAHGLYIRTLLSSTRFYSLNLDKLDHVNSVVNKLVRLDRLPSTNTLESLLLLQDAWRDYDVSMLLADRYKLGCKLLFVFQLFLGWLIILGSSLGIHFGQVFSEEHDTVIALNNTVFGLAIAVSFVISLDGMLAPKSRWRQFRSSAGSLESIIWMYRTRVGPFSLDEQAGRDSKLPEAALCGCINEWRDNLMAGAALKRTNAQRKYQPAIYKHFQDQGSPVDGADDFHSPTQPNRYIDLRINPSIDFYARRIPLYSRSSILLTTFTVLLGIVASVLARFEELTWVSIMTAGATAVMSWTEFSDASRKVERYSSAVVNLKKLLSWWKSLGAVQKASKESIETLVRSAEEIISQEQTSWMSVAGKAPKEEGNSDDGTEPVMLNAFV